MCYKVQIDINEILDAIAALVFSFFFKFCLHNCESGSSIHKGSLTIKQPANKKINDSPTPHLWGGVASGQKYIVLYYDFE